MEGPFTHCPPVSFRHPVTNTAVIKENFIDFRSSWISIEEWLKH